MTSLICPALREFVVQPPYRLGQATAHLGKGFVLMGEVYFAYEDALWDSYPAQLYANVSETIRKISGQAFQLEVGGTAVRGMRNRLGQVAMLGAMIAGMTNYGAAAGRGIEERLPNVYGIYQVSRHYTVKVAEMGGWLLDKSIQAINYPQWLQLRVMSSVGKSMYYGIQSKALLVPASVYLVSRPTYKILCQEYEKGAQNAPDAKSLDIGKEFIKGYKLTKERLFEAAKPQPAEGIDTEMCYRWENETYSAYSDNEKGAKP